MPTVSALHVYPIKSCRGVSVDRAEVVRRGLAHDRRWMVVDAGGRFVTQRAQPRMALVDVAIEGDALRLEAPGMGALLIPLEVERGERRAVEVWGDRCEGVVHGEASAWFSSFLGIACALVHMPADVERAVEPESARPGDLVSFADGFPFLLTSEASLDDLNGRLVEPVSMIRFRPNIVVRGAPPFAEDGWGPVRIGSLGFVVAKKCVRCTIPTVDPQSGRRGKEPLRTLARYRNEDGEVMFGVNLVHDGAGEVRVGDSVEPLDRTGQPPQR